MTLFGKIISVGVVTACMFVSLATGAWGQAPSSPFGGELRGPIRIRGKVLCVGCTLDEVPSARPGEGRLCELAYRKGKLVIQVSWVSEPQLWSYLASPPRLWARGGDGLFQTLTAEENLFREVEITAIPSHSLQTLDIAEVKVRGKAAPREE